MTGFRKHCIASASVLAIGLAAFPAIAQEAAPEAAAPQAAAPEAVGVEEIVVTASKRTESLQDVGMAVSAVGGERLADAQIDNLEDLQAIVPSITIGNDFNQAKLFIRGVGANTSTTGNATGVALHVDGAVVSRAEAQLTSMFDLERVEVLRGPQGTLYGRNATGGSINLITAKPTSSFEGYGRVSYGNYSALTLEAAVSGPITDGINARLAVKSEDRDGFGENPVTGRDIDDLNRRMARAQIDFRLSDTANLLLMGEYFRQDDSSGALKFSQAAFPGVARLAPIGAGGFAAKPRDLASEIQPGTSSETYAATATLNVDLNDALSLTDIANYRSFKASLVQDLDLSAILNSLPTTGKATSVQERRIDSEQYSNELQFKVDTDFVKGVMGLFYFHERQRPIDTVGLGPRYGMTQNIAVLQAAGVNLADAYAMCGIDPADVAGGGGVAPKRVCISSNLGTEAYAAFGQMVFNLGALTPGLDGFRVKLGGRYSHEKVDSANPAIIIARNGLGPVIQYTTAGTYRERTFKDFTPEAGVEWSPNEDVLLYYTYSEGFKAGSGENAAGSTTIVRPETLKNHEAGIKSSWFDRRLTVNVAAYSYKLKDLQINKTIAGGPAGFTTVFENAAKTSAEGIELEVAARPVPSVRLSGALSYTDAQFDDFLTLDPLNPVNVATPPSPAYNPVTNPDPTAFGAPGGGIIQLAGNPTRNTPKWAWNLHGEYDLPIDALGDGSLTVAGDVSHKGDIFFTEFHRFNEGSHSYTMFDAMLTYKTGDERIKVQAWVKNLTDVFRPTSSFALSTGRVLGVTYLPPRTYGLTVGYNF